MLCLNNTEISFVHFLTLSHLRKEGPGAWAQLLATGCHAHPACCPQHPHPRCHRGLPVPYPFRPPQPHPVDPSQASSCGGSQQHPWELLPDCWGSRRGGVPRACGGGGCAMGWSRCCSGITSLRTEHSFPLAQAPFLTRHQALVLRAACTP